AHDAGGAGDAAERAGQAVDLARARRRSEARAVEREELAGRVAVAARRACDGGAHALLHVRGGTGANVTIVEGGAAGREEQRGKNEAKSTLHGARTIARVGGECPALLC